jgi:hypothetical protein
VWPLSASPDRRLLLNNRRRASHRVCSRKYLRADHPTVRPQGPSLVPSTSLRLPLPHWREIIGCPSAFVAGAFRLPLDFPLRQGAINQFDDMQDFLARLVNRDPSPQLQNATWIRGSDHSSLGLLHALHFSVENLQ